MSARVTRKITVGLDDAIAFLNGDHSRATVVQKGEDGEWHDITANWNAENRSNTREPHRAASAGTDSMNEASDPKSSPRAPEAG